MKGWGAIAGAVLVAGVVLAGSNGVGTGGLTGFPNAGVNGSAITPSSVTTPLLKADVIDAGVLNVQGAAGIAGDLTLSAGNLNFGATGFRISSPGGNYIGIFNSTGQMFSTGGTAQPSYSLGASATGGTLTDSATAPTVANGCTGEAVTWNAGTANFRFDVGTSCSGVTSTVITLPTTANCWTCNCYNIVSDATLQEAFSGCSTTSFTISNRTRLTTTATDFVDGADIQCSCRGG